MGGCRSAPEVTGCKGVFKAFQRRRLSWAYMDALRSSNGLGGGECKYGLAGVEKYFGGMTKREVFSNLIDMSEYLQTVVKHLDILFDILQNTLQSGCLQPHDSLFPPLPPLRRRRHAPLQLVSLHRLELHIKPLRASSGNEC